MDVNSTARTFLWILWFGATIAILWMAVRRRTRIKALPPTAAKTGLQLVNGAVFFGGLVMLAVAVYNLLTRL